MTITAEQFATGLTMDEYRAQMTQNAEAFAAGIAAAPVAAEDAAVFAEMPEPLNVLVITEDWCGDSLAHLPMLFRLAQESGKLHVRVFKRDEHRDLAAHYPLPTGRVAIPIAVFLDGEMRERGRFLERPDTAHAEVDAFMTDFFTRHPEHGTPGTVAANLTPEGRQALFAALAPWRKARLDEWNRAAIAQFAQAATGTGKD